MRFLPQPWFGNMIGYKRRFSGLFQLLPETLTINGISILPEIQFVGNDVSGDTIRLRGSDVSIQLNGAGADPVIEESISGYRAVDFSTGGKYYETSDASIGQISSEDIAIEFIFKPGDDLEFLGRRAPSLPGWQVGLVSGDPYFFCVNSSGSPNAIIQSDVQASSGFNHCMIFIDRSGSGSIFINGLFSGSAPFSISNMTTPHKLRFGNIETQSGSADFSLSLFNLWISDDWLDTDKQYFIPYSRSKTLGLQTSALPDELTINGSTVSPDFVLNGNHAASTGWPGAGFGERLSAFGSGTSVSYSDSSIYNYGSVSFSGAGGASDTSERFRGSNTPYNLGLNDYAQEFIFKRSSTLPSVVGAIYSMKNSNGQIGTDWYISSAGQLFCRLLNGPGKYLNVAAATEPDTWYHAMVFCNRDENSDNGVKLYLNGSLSASGNFSSNNVDISPSDAPWSIGGNPGSTANINYCYNGEVAHAAQWQMRDWYPAGASGPGCWSGAALSRSLSVFYVADEIETYGPATSFYSTNLSGGYRESGLSLSGTGSAPSSSTISGFKISNATSCPVGRYYQSTSSLSPGAGDFIVEYIGSPDNGNFQEKIGSYDSGEGSGWYIGFDSDADPFLWMRDGANAVSPGMPGMPGTPGHYMWFVSRANGSCYCYLNGSLHSTVSIASLTGPLSGDNFVIGGPGTGTPLVSSISYWEGVSVLADNDSIAQSRYSEVSF